MPVMKARKERLDVLVAERGLAESRQQAQRLIMVGRVRVDDRPVDKPGMRVPIAADIVVEGSLPYVSRGGYKLAAALEAFQLDVRDWVVADVGASTGGFTDCLLQRGAGRLYAIDVGYGQLAWKLQQDPRVVIMDRTNARYLEALPEPVDLVTVDASFISLKLIVPMATRWLKPGAPMVTLIKPQFEAGRSRVKGGVVQDPAVHQAVLEDLIDWATSQGMGLLGLIRSPITGPAGNVEFLAHWQPGESSPGPIAPMIQACIE